MRVKGEKPKDIKAGIHATFENTGDGVQVKGGVNANQEEIEALIKSLIEMLAEGNKVHVSKVLMDISVSMMEKDLGGKE